MIRPKTIRVVASDGVPVAAESDGALFEVFFEDRAPTLFRRLYLITGDRSEAEEIMQDAFVIVFERWERVLQMDDPEGYLYRVAFNIQRKVRRRASLAIRRAVRLASPVDDFAAVEDRTVVAAALAALTPRQRTALVLTEVLGHTSAEAAAIMHVRPGTVRVLTHQGRAAMRTNLEQAHD